MIEAQDISKKYENKTVLQHVDLEIPRGQLIAFIGPNGAGKSTFLSLVSRLQPQSSGDIFLDREEVRSWKSKELAKKLAILKQSNTIQLNITVRELVSFGRFPYNRGRLTAEDEALIDQAINQMELQEMVNESIHSLSGGQLQRVYIAMILAQDTEYVLLDEPLNNLDMNHANQMMHLLKKLVEEQNKTVLIVLHDINFAAGFADHIVAMKNGEIFAKGPTDEIIQPEILNKLYGMNIRICEVEGKRFCMYFS
ncbi:ATP-binding cassette domain-containing protein [Enterococcus saccharolyticus]|uniref:Iron ABC transporter ATP-binding protein n=1 Tax=Candidatus Enterococcus willemsii TaxID=1857215 RepID=A0ABQ6Z3D8_9ENTE|nr:MULTISPECIES: ATP-binding cassette domain-containing protein [Enterococcus]KAF1306005.1 iron ABC transporter ATP-binding protein [Enterococcus sp. CU12B]MCD5003245.1 ATP-binding cassette domain-containing protein [Enterococcus saccharolyticus]